MEKRALIWVLIFLAALGVLPSHAGVPPLGVILAQEGAPSTSAPPCIARGLPTVLARQQLGDAIQDGVGYGGVRVGDTVWELVRRWGGGDCPASSPEPTYRYVASRSANGDGGELVVVQIRRGRVFTLIFMPLPHGGHVPPSLTTSLGIRLLATPADVRRAYGAPDVETARVAIYTGRGIGFFGYFDQLDPFVFGIFVFPPGTPPAALDILTF